MAIAPQAISGKTCAAIALSSSIVDCSITTAISLNQSVAPRGAGLERTGSPRMMWIRRSLSFLGLVFIGWLVSNLSAHSFAHEATVDSNAKPNVQTGQRSSGSEAITLLGKPVSKATNTLAPVLTGAADKVGAVTQKPLTAVGEQIAPASSLVNGLQPTIRRLDTATKPLTVQVGQLVQPIAQAAAPVTQPIAAVAAPATAPILNAAPIFSGRDSVSIVDDSENRAIAAGTVKEKVVQSAPKVAEHPFLQGIQRTVTHLSDRATSPSKQRAAQARASHMTIPQPQSPITRTFTSPPAAPSTSSVNGGTAPFGAAAELPATSSRHGLEQVAIKRVAERGSRLPHISDQPGTSPD